MASDSHSTTHTERTRQVSRIPPPRIPERHAALHVRDSPARDKLSTRPLRVADGSFVRAQLDYPFVEDDKQAEFCTVTDER